MKIYSKHSSAAPDPDLIQTAAAIKPPLGVMPQDLWIEQRKQDLQRAISEYVQAGIYEPVDDWLAELRELG